MCSLIKGTFHIWESKPRFLFLFCCVYLIQLILVSHCSYAKAVRPLHDECAWFIVLDWLANKGVSVVSPFWQVAWLSLYEYKRNNRQILCNPYALWYLKKKKQLKKLSFGCVWGSMFTQVLVLTRFLLRQEFKGARQLGRRSRHGRRVSEGPEKPVCGGRSSHPLPGGSQQGMGNTKKYFGLLLFFTHFEHIGFVLKCPIGDPNRILCFKRFFFSIKRKGPCEYSAAELP